MAGQTVNVAVLAETSRFARSMADAGKDAEGFGAKVANVGKGIGLAVGAAAVGLVAFVKSSVDAAAASEVVAAQTEAAVKSTGGAAQRSADQIGDLALQLSNLTGIDDEVVQGAENILLTFTNIKGDQFDATTRAALDMSQALGTDANAAAMQLGKALNDPIAGVTKLTKQGVTFTEQQKQQIAAMQEAGDVAGAQGIILAEVQKEFGGSAEAFGNTLEGTKEKIGNAFGNIQETIGGAFLPVLTAAGSKVALFLQNLGESDRFTAFVQAIADSIGSFIAGDGPLGAILAVVMALAHTVGPIFAQAFAPVVPILAQLGGAFLSLAPNISPVMLIFRALQPVIPTLVQALGQLATGVLSTLVGLFRTLAPVIGQVAGVLVSLLSGVFVALMPEVVQIVSTLGSALVQLTPILQSIIGAIVPVVSALLAGLLPVILTLVQTALPPLVDLFTAVVSAVVPLVAQIVSALMPAFQAIVPVVQPVISILSAVLIPIIQALLPVVQTVFDAIVPIIQAALQIISGVIKIVTGIITGNWSQVWDGIKDVVIGVWNLIKSVVTGALSILGAVIKAGLSIIGTVFAAVWNGAAAVVSAVVGSIVNGARALASGIGDGIRGAINWVTSLGSRITGALSGAGDWLRDAGGRVIDGFVRGITSSLSAVNRIAARIGNAIMDGVKGILGIHSPSREMAKLGAFSIDGFAKGLSDLAPVERAMSALTDTVLTPITPTAFADAAPLGTGDRITVVAQMLEPTPQAGRVIANALDEWQRKNGTR